MTAFNKGEVLTRAQLKKVMGGVGGSLGGGSPVCKDVACQLITSGNVKESGFCSSYGFMDGDRPIVECFCQTDNHSTPATITSSSNCNV